MLQHTSNNNFPAYLLVKRAYTEVYVVTACLSCKTNAGRVNLAYEHYK